jgi:hypothetical protein
MRVRFLLVLAACAIVSLNGLAYGILTHRWASLDQTGLDAASARLDSLPLHVGAWDGHVVPMDQDAAWQDVVGHNVTVRYVNRLNGQGVIVYLACGRTSMMELHTPLECYASRGYQLLGTELSCHPDGAADGTEFCVANFSKSQGSIPDHLRVFWSWSAGQRWLVTNSLGRTFRQQPFLYKLYVIRHMISPDEPLEHDPANQFMKEFLPVLENVLGTPA